MMFDKARNWSFRQATVLSENGDGIFQNITSASPSRSGVRIEKDLFTTETRRRGEGPQSDFQLAISWRVYPALRLWPWDCSPYSHFSVARCFRGEM